MSWRTRYLFGKTRGDELYVKKAEVSQEAIVPTPTLDPHATTKLYVDDLVAAIQAGLDWQESCINFYDPTVGLPPHNPGNRWIASATGNGWTQNNIYESDGSQWIEIVPDLAFATFVEILGRVYIFTGGGWVAFGTTVDHANLDNLDYASSGHTGFAQDPHNHVEADITDLDKYTQAEVDALLADVGYPFVTVGTSGADYDNFDDAIDYLQALGGGTIIVTSNIDITSTAVKDVSNIHFIGNEFYSQSRQISKSVNGGYWHGNNVRFSNLWLYRIGDSGANEIFRFTEDISQIRLRWVQCQGIGALSPPSFNCNNFEAHIDAEYGQVGVEAASYEAVSNYGGLVLHLYNNAEAYVTGNMDLAYRDASTRITGGATFATGDNLVDVASGVLNDSSRPGATVKDALENLPLNGTYDISPIDALQMTKLGSRDPDLVQLFDNGAGSIGVYGYAFDSTNVEELFFSITMPYTIDNAENVTYTIKSMAQSGVPGSAVWKLEYNRANPGEAFAANTTIETSAQSYTVANQVERTGQVTIGTMEPGSTIFGRIYRDPGHGSDDLSVDAVLAGIDFIFQKADAIGAASSLP